MKIDFFETEFEEFLNIDKPSNNRGDLKPLNVMWNYFNKKIDDEVLNSLKIKIDKLLINV